MPSTKLPPAIIINMGRSNVTVMVRRNCRGKQHRAIWATGWTIGNAKERYFKPILSAPASSSMAFLRACILLFSAVQ